MGAEPVRPDDESRPVARVPWLASWWRSVRRVFRRETLGKDAVAGTVLGIEAVPDALAIGLLAGVNPVAGIYAFMFGMAGAALRDEQLVSWRSRPRARSRSSSPSETYRRSPVPIRRC